MVRNVVHELLPAPTHDERARQDFVLQLKRLVATEARPAARRAWETRVRPRLVAALGHEPGSVAEIGDAMRQEPAYQRFSALNRSAQELMWEAVAEPILRERERLGARFRELADSPTRRGSLTLDPALLAPESLRRTHVHLQPGGYTLDLGPDDILAGALYEAGGALFSRGQGVGTRESKAEVVGRFLAERHPGLAPRRILDLGCGIGSSTTPYAFAFPEAEVHGVDVGAGLLRYAHARAEAIGAPVHFRQADAARTPFPDASFDLVISHNAMHEMSTDTVAGMFRETHRVLRPGGVCVHQDVPFKLDAFDAYQQFDYSWDQWHNNEPHWLEYARSDARQLLEEAGFAAAGAWDGRLAQLDGSFAWYVVTARREDRS